MSTLITFLILITEDTDQLKLTHLLGIFVLNLGTGMMTHIANQNILFMLISNVTCFYAMSYFLTKKRNKTILIPFGFQYLFMLYTPVNNDELLMRLFALLIGALIVVIILIMKHKHIEPLNFIIDKQNFKIGQFIFKLKEILSLSHHKKTQPERFDFAIRLTIAIAVSSLIVELLAIQQGRWMVITAFSLTEFQHHSFKVKSKQRLTGTLLGIIFASIFFSFVKIALLRQALILAGGYLDAFTRNYHQKMTCVTISVVASSAISQPVSWVSIERFSLVLFGIIIVILVNKTFKKLALYPLHY